MNNINNTNNTNNNQLVARTSQTFYESHPELYRERSSKEFVENVKKWVLCDQQLKLVKEKSDKIRDMKHILGSSICTYMNENNLSQNEIEITNGKIKIYEKREYSPLTFSYIEQCLAKIIPDKSHVEYIIQFLKENREIKTSTDLKSIYKK